MVVLCWTFLLLESIIYITYGIWEKPTWRKSTRYTLAGMGHPVNSTPAKSKLYCLYVGSLSIATMYISHLQENNTCFLYDKEPLSYQDYYLDDNPVYVKTNQCGQHKSSSCTLWAKIGECTKNPRYMLVNCHKTCPLCNCPNIDSNCTDIDVKCCLYSYQGKCFNDTYTITNCKFSCNFC